MSNLSGAGLKEFVISKIGTPYVYGAKLTDGIFTQAKLNFLAKNYPKMFTHVYLRKIAEKELVGKVCTDCSGLITAYTGKVLGSAQMYSQAIVRIPYSDFEKMPVGTVLWKSGHVGVFCGKNSKGQYYCVEARGIDYGTVATICTKKNNWKYGLLFNGIDYVVDDPEIKALLEVQKTKNPYEVPTVTVKRGSKGNIARWLQWELVEAGYDQPFTYNYKTYSGVKIDGNIGPISEAALLSFQQSCKIEADGKCGKITQQELLKNKGE